MKKEGNKRSRTKSKTQDSLNASAIMSQLDEWAAEGTEAALHKLDAFIQEETNDELLDYAYFVYGTAQYAYYAPKNDAEQKAYMLAKLIQKKEARLWKLLSEQARLEVELLRIETENEVFDALMKKQSKKRKDAWKYRYMGDVLGIRNKRDMIAQDIRYERAWIAQATSMVVQDKYKQVPEHVFEQLKMSGNGSYYWVDDIGYPCEDDLDEEVGCCAHCHKDGYMDDDIDPTGDWEDYGIRVEDIPF